MKLRNKKTGEIGNLVLNINPNRESFSVLSTENGDTICGNLVLADYDSLAELNAEWEDVPEEEPKEYWFINDLDGEPMKCDLRNCGKQNFTRWSEHRKQIGNWFETAEEAQQAVEKLKAWKLLKDECNIKFDGIIRDDRAMLKAVKLVYDRHEVTFDRMRECMDALHLLFGGEE